MMKMKISSAHLPPAYDYLASRKTIYRGFMN
jgi:hypothetical protein